MATDIDAEIASLRARRDALRRELTAHASPSLFPATAQQRTYRACAGVTAFRAQDPSPSSSSADGSGGGGFVLGLRIEAMAAARPGCFARPYYVLLEPAGGTGAAADRLRVRSHTVPPCIPLPALAHRYLPQSGERPQDLAGLARALRRAVVRYRVRVGVVAALRAQAGLGKGESAEQGEDGEAEMERQKDEQGTGVLAAGPVRNICAADAEVRQVTIEWEDGRTGRLVLDDDGEVARLVVFDEEGARDLATARKLLTAATKATKG
ncbi:hypothetical protein NKR23_g1757 [Pleurostoma richardsiae]|uniref:Cenp-O kinetochore centromere component n=1 Tax=Pleurostoma richardsiae TaxID=41990 RepID=A0AA38RR13_9PEZI|nr:hypothetical protein NKR23_g1757 [Pleurostoma richardsiae]